ncbi:glycosyltransferase [Saliphagus infecundisoli]|uniref:Glycosyltransferase n=1 Tax=Saliphagus infecundisoli TaxID=1849069 RepID=A0ABD5QDL3_9EURY|nr:glycosyltransferase [Saliphagus infecundisoli]
MRIGILAHSFPKLSETFVLDNIIGMMDRGHDVSVFSLLSAHDSIQHPTIQEYDILERTTYLDTPNSVPAALLETVPNTMLLAANAPEALGVIAKIERERGVLEAGRFAYRAHPVLHAELDVLHAHFGPVGRRAARFDQIGACDAFVVSFHGWGIRRADEHGEQIYAHLFDHADCILANTRYTRERLIEFGADPDTVRVHHVGINPDRFRPDDRTHDSDTMTVLTVARLHETKGLEYGILAAKKLSKRLQDVDVRYRIVGSGSLEGKLRKQIQENDASDVVTLCGPMDQTGVIDELHSADVFLLPSLEEGFGRVLLEAQASELPVVASDVGGIPEAVSPGDSALLVPPRDTEAIADRLKQLANDPSTRATLGAAGRTYVRDNFDIEDLNDRLEALYAELV